MELETVAEEAGPETQESCPTCGSTEFVQEGGFYYCVLCFTQSQVSRIYLDDVFRPEQHGPNRTRAQTLREKKQTADQAQDELRILSTWEAWNVVLKYMADRLVEIGFPEIIRAKILSLYVLFLQRRKVIFVSTIHPHKTSRVSLREPVTNLQALLGLRKISTVKNSRKRKKFDRKTKVKSKAPDPNEMTKRMKTIQKRKALEHDYTAQQTDVPVVNEDEFDDMIEGERQANEAVMKLRKSRTGGWGRIPYTKLARHLIRKNAAAKSKNLRLFVNGRYRKPRKVSLRLETFTLTKCLITVFTALRQLGFSVGITDIVRLCRVGILEPHNLKQLIHSVEEYRDTAVCRINNPAAFEIARLYNLGTDAANFVDYLGIKKFNHPRVKELIPKYVDEFVLPREFECFATLLDDLFPFDDYRNDLWRKVKLENYRLLPEILILAQFIVVLKLFFGLDDKTEKYQSEFARLVNQIISEEVQQNDWELDDWSELFVIEDWFQYLRRRRIVVTRELCSAKMYTPNKPPSSAKLNDLMKNRAVDDNEDDLGMEKKTHVEAAESCKAIFEEIFITAMQNQGKSPEIPCLRPYVPLPCPTESIARQYVERYPIVADTTTKPHLLAHNFVAKRIDFMWNPSKYAKLLKLRGYNVKIINGDAVNNFPHDLASDLEKSKLVLVFLPYKSFDDFIGGCKEDYSSSIKFLLELCDDLIPEVSPINDTKSSGSPPLLVKLVNSIGDMFVKRVLTELIPVLTRCDQ